MRCREARDLLSAAAGEALPPRLEEHLASCGDCDRLAARWAAARRQLAAPRARVEPDVAFAARVVASLPATPDVIGWAALRLLPATLALALALTAWCLLAVPGPASLVDASPIDDPLGWSVGSAEDRS